MGMLFFLFCIIGCGVTGILKLERLGRSFKISCFVNFVILFNIKDFQIPS